MTTGASDEGSPCHAPERSLSELLELDEEVNILTSGLNFELKALMTHWAGCNPRSRYAHGLISDQQLATHPIVVAWWAVLRMALETVPLKRPSRTCVAVAGGPAGRTRTENAVVPKSTNLLDAEVQI